MISTLRSSWLASRIGRRLLAFNLLVVFTPIVGVLSLHTYEARMLQAQERTMAQQAATLAGVLEDEAIDPRQASSRLLARLAGDIDPRIRVFSADGVLLADSASAHPASLQQRGSAYSPSERARSTRARVLYRAGVWLVDAKDAVASLVLRTPVADVSSEPSGVSAALKSALAGKYGAATRPTPGQRSLTLFAAVPIRRDGAVAGAVVVSQSTFRILQALYEVRLRIFTIVIGSVGLALVLSAAAAMTIVRPLTRLRTRAATLDLRGGPLSDAFPGAERRDEVGDLARTLADLARRVNTQIALLEAVTADVAHEFKNPLASIRTAAELAADAGDAGDRHRFLMMLRGDVDRLERLVSGMRDVARLESRAAADGPAGVELHGLLEEAIGSVHVPEGRKVTMVSDGPRDLAVHGSRDHLLQVFENVIGNAVEFAPAGTTVVVRVERGSSACVVFVEDNGPGIPEAHLGRVFERFFSYRPSDKGHQHIGLGLAIARQAVARSGGCIAASNRPGGGARFEIRLRRA